MADKVLFLVHPEGDLFAAFPHIPGTLDCLTMMSYAHVGQHSACHIDYVRESRLATEAEYADLKKELEGIGYKLRIETETGVRDTDIRHTEISKDEVEGEDA